MPRAPWRIVEGPGPLVATALHSGHDVRAEVRRHLGPSARERLREEDPFTDAWTLVAPTRVAVLRSRFEVDLNRPREDAIYRTPDEAWGLRPWADELPAGVVRRSLAIHDAFYRTMQRIFSRKAGREGAVVVFDLHSYNHRRDGPDAPAQDGRTAPEVNVGTGTMDRERWGPLVDRFMETLASVDFPGGRLDVRENVRFRGGHFARWTHETFPEVACVLAIEVRKFFMDEWTGRRDARLTAAVGAALQETTAPVLAELGRLVPALR